MELLVEAMDIDIDYNARAHETEDESVGIDVPSEPQGLIARLASGGARKKVLSYRSPFEARNIVLRKKSFFTLRVLPGPVKDTSIHVIEAVTSMYRVKDPDSGRTSCGTLFTSPTWFYTAEACSNEGDLQSMWLHQFPGVLATNVSRLVVPIKYLNRTSNDAWYVAILDVTHSSMSLRIYDSGPQSSHELRGHTVKIGRTYEEIKSVIVRSFAALAKTEVQRGVDPRAATMDQQLMQARLDALKKLTQTDNPSVVQIPTLTATWASPNKSAGLFVLAIMKSLFEGAAVDAMETVVRDCFQDPDSFTTKMEKLSEEIAIQLCDQFMTEPVADQDTRKRGESPVLSRKKKKKAANVQQAQYKPYTIKPNKRQFRIGGEVRSLDPVDNTTKSLSLKNRRAHSWFNAILGYTPREEPPPVNHNTAVAAAKASFLREKDLTDYMSSALVNGNGMEMTPCVQNRSKTMICL